MIWKSWRIIKGKKNLSTKKHEDYTRYFEKFGVPPLGGIRQRSAAVEPPEGGLRTGDANLLYFVNFVNCVDEILKIIMRNLSLLAVLIFVATVNAVAQMPNQFIPKKDLSKSRLELTRRTQNGSFYDVIGRKSAAFGYEHRNMKRGFIL